jgi:type II secretory pathway pseudopilin PulG
MNRTRRNPGDPAQPRAAFSMIELLIVVALLLVLVTMFWGFESKDSRRQKQKSCEANLQKLYLALDIFAGEHTNDFPIIPGATTSEAALAPLVPKYTADLSAFICPASGDASLASGKPLTAQRISYAYYMGTRRANGSLPLLSDQQVNSLPKAIGQPVFSPDGKAPGNNHKEAGGNILFSDGRTEHSRAAATVALTPPAGVTLLNPRP